RAEADGEEGRPVVDPAPERRVLLVQPRMLELLADVLLAAEHDHRVDIRGRRRPPRDDVPLEELMAFVDDHVAEELGPAVRSVRDGGARHGALGTRSPSSGLRRSCAPGVACGTPCVWLLLLKNAYASSASFESSRNGPTPSRSSSSS